MNQIFNIFLNIKKEAANLFPSKEEKEAAKILPFLLQKRDEVNGEPLKNWCDYDSSSLKYAIVAAGEKGYIIEDYYHFNYLLIFKTEKIAQKFLETYKKEINILRPLL